jgi:oligo-1,6-glucosidase
MIHDPQHRWFGKTPWWKEATIYQIYPASFKDSNGDGLGDLPGVLEKLDYLQNLGIDCIWLSPCFDSPQEDMGYDVSDYQNIYPPYGTVADVDALIAACHERNMKLVIDLVVNHTSDQHPWFKESRKSETSSKRDWYIWRPPKYTAEGQRLPPTNWRSYFAGSTWTYDEDSGEYYLHLYAPSQPDLNWDNPVVRRAVYKETMNFWLDRGCDGFRIDTVNKYSKDTRFIDAAVTDPESSCQPAPEMWCNGPHIHEYLREMHDHVLGPRDAASIGELSNCPTTDSVLPYVKASDPQMSMCFQFDMIRLGTGGGFGDKYIYQPFKLSELKSMTEKWQTFIEGTDAWTTVFTENHDNGRAVSRFGDTSSREVWQRSAKTLAMWQATLTGTLFLYQGQEIGMRNMPPEWGIHEYKDIESLGFYEEAKKSGSAQRIQMTLEGLQILARDHSRVPMQWDAGHNAGFTTADTPWMRVVDTDLEVINVAAQSTTDDSVLRFWQHLLRLRKEHSDVFVHGIFRLLHPESESLFAYIKQSILPEAVDQHQGLVRKALVVMNWSATEQEHPSIATALDCDGDKVRLLAGTLGLATAGTMLGPWEGRIYVNF